MLVERAESSFLQETKLPDGSRVVVDTRNDAVIAMNASAGLAWEACNQPTTLSAIAADVEKAGMTPEAAEDAVFQLREKKLVTTSEIPQPSRRTFIAGMAAVPVVAAMSLAEQKVFAERAGSLEPGPINSRRHRFNPAPPRDPKRFMMP